MFRSHRATYLGFSPLRVQDVLAENSTKDNGLKMAPTHLEPLHGFSFHDAMQIAAPHNLVVLLPDSPKYHRDVASK